VGVPSRLLYYLLLGLIGLTVVVCLRTLGVLLVTALLVIPASAGRQLARRVPTMMLAAVAVSCLSALAGLLLSYYLNVGSGASIVLCSAACFAASLLVGRRRTGGAEGERRRDLRSPTRSGVEDARL
jgi:ABC-type Mn2+/Zn2+ transport system permease subunit